MTSKATLASLFIDGVDTASSDDTTVVGVNPSTELSQLNIPVGTAEDVDRAVGSARRAFEEGTWRGSPSVRKAALQRLADLMAANASTLDYLDAEEMGKPVSLGTANAQGAAHLMRFYAEALDKVTGEVFASDEKSLTLTRRVPYGVVGAVTPWNFPCMNAMRKLGPALAAGNAVVLKPSEHSARSATRIAQLAIEAGIPPGILNVVQGLGRTAGAAIAKHEDVDLVTFTGSTAVGKAILSAAAISNMKPVIAECGGKSPQIVFSDCVDLDAVASVVARSILTNQGQVCSAGSRLLVQQSIAAELVDRVAARFADIVIGNACDSHTTFGPLVSVAQFDRVMTYISEADRGGLRCRTGGRRVALQSTGYFIEPTIYVDVPPEARIAREEIFGPVLAVIPFKDELEAIAFANGTIYGLAAYLWTCDLSRGLRVAKAIRSPVFVNAAVPSGEGAGHAFTFEPQKQSGLGVEGGIAGMEGYLRRQGIWINHA